MVLSLLSLMLVLRLQSIAVTIHWAPNISDDSLTKSGFLTAAVLIDTLSAPALRILRTASVLLMPSLTVRGLKTSSAVLAIASILVPLRSCVAVMSRETSSSAPCSLYFFASCTGSPASFKLTNSIPFTTQPPALSRVTSRQGIIRFVSIGLLSLFKNEIVFAVHFIMVNAYII